MGDATGMRIHLQLVKRQNNPNIGWSMIRAALVGTKMRQSLLIVIAITGDVQVICDPADNPSQVAIVVLGLRAQFDL